VLRRQSAETTISSSSGHTGLAQPRISGTACIEAAHGEAREFWDTLTINTAQGHMVDMAADDNGNFVVVWCWMTRWKDRRYTPNASSTAHGARGRRLGQSETAAREGFPQVTIFGNKEIIATWEHHFPSYTGIQARYFNGTTWLAAQGIDAGSSAGTLCRTPQIASQQDGTAIVVFSQGTGSSLKIYANRYSGEPGAAHCRSAATSMARTTMLTWTGTGTPSRLRLESRLPPWWLIRPGSAGSAARHRVPTTSAANLTDFEKRVVLTPHEIHGTWQVQEPSNTARIRWKRQQRRLC